MLIRSLAFMSISALLGLSQSANALSVTFDFSAGQNRFFTDSVHTFTGSDGRSTVEVSAGNNSRNYSSYIAGSRWGLLICTRTGGAAPTDPNGSCGDGNGDYHWIDGGDGSQSDPDEAAQLHFGSSVTLRSATFYENFGRNTDFDLIVDGTLLLNEQRVGQTVGFGPSGITGTRFNFLADGNEDKYKLRSITVDIAEVPLPAAGWLFGSGLLGLAAACRRRPG